MLALNPSLADAVQAVRRLEAALGETPTQAPPGGGGGTRSRGGGGGGGGGGGDARSALTAEDVRGVEECKARVREVAAQKARARESQAGAAREQRQLELTLGQVASMPADARLFRPIGKMFLASPRPELTAVLGDKVARCEKKLAVCATALSHLERQEQEADAAFLEAVAAIERKAGGGRRATPA